MRHVAAAAVLLAALGPASSALASPPRVTARPYLARLSATHDSVVVGFRLSAPAATVTVSIAGRPARVNVVGPRKDAVYEAFLQPAGLKAGRLKVGHSYVVTITASDAHGDHRRFSRRLYLHKRFRGHAI